MDRFTVRPVRRGGENEALARLAALLPAAPPGEVWAGDDAAVLNSPGGGPPLLLACDAVVVGPDADLNLTTLADLGWKALAVTLSDIAAMGGVPGHALVSVVGLGPDGLEDLYEGLLAASAEYDCPVVGGDLSGGGDVVVSVAVTGWVPGGRPVLRAGARPGDAVWVTGPLGASAAGLRLLRHKGANGHRQSWPTTEAPLVAAHCRPRPAMAAGTAARLAGATAMIDVSDGFSLDLSRLASSSEVGFELDEVPCAEGATLDDALSGGEDFVLIFTTDAEADVAGIFSDCVVPAPIRVGRCVADPQHYHLAGETLVIEGWEHTL